MKAFENFSRERLSALKLDENWRFSQFEKLAKAVDQENPEHQEHQEFPELQELQDLGELRDLQESRSREIIVPAGTQKTLVEIIAAGTQERTLSTKISVGENAKLRRIVVQIAPAGTAVLTNDEIVAAGTAAEIEQFYINLGGEYLRSTITLRATAEHASIKTQILNCAAGTQICDVRTAQIHESPNTRSDLLCKNILSGRATTIFGGNIVVVPAAQKIAATQTCRNLSLSAETTTHSLPGLEIDANDVQCSHGATNSSIDPEQIFYFLQRGVPAEIAQRMLVLGFADETLAQLGVPALAEKLSDLISAKF